MHFYLFDYISMGIMLILALNGYRKGAISSLLNLVGLIASFIISWIAAPAVSAYLMTIPKIQEMMLGWIVPLLQRSGMETLQSVRAGMLSGSGLTNESLNSLIQSGSIQVTEALNQTALVLGERLLSIIAFFVLLLLLNIVLGAIKHLFNKVNHVPVLGTLNRIIGLGLGGAIGILVSGVVIFIALTWATVSGDATLISQLTSGGVTAAITRLF